MTDKPTVVYTTYIRTTPEKLWKALTDPELTAMWWEHRSVSTWTVGAAWAHRGIDGKQVTGTILEIDPPRRLSHTWAWPDQADGPPGTASRLTFDLEPAGDTVRLTLTHEDIPADTTGPVAEVWMIILANLKSVVETGQPVTTASLLELYQGVRASAAGRQA